MYIGATLLSVMLIFLLSELIVFAQQSYHFPVYPTREYMRPLRGGLQIQITYGTNSETCTLGYFVRHDTSYGFVTAGHCISNLWPGGNPVWVSIYQPNYTRSDYLVGPNAYYLISGDIDAAFIPLNTGVSWEAWIINITGENSYTTVSIYGYVDWDNVKLGERVCKTGRTTGTTCGYVINKRDRYNNLLDAIITNITAASGDSGSPLYYHVMPGGRSLATYILGHLSRGENCTLAIVNGELAYLCPITIFVSARAIRNTFGATICNVITGC